jgi:hypothetical protein
MPSCNNNAGWRKAARHCSTPNRFLQTGRKTIMHWKSSLAFGAMLFAAASAFAQSQTFTPRDENPEEFPAGQGREETFYFCTACHNFKLVAQQGMSHRQWDDTLNWMTEKHNMPKLEGKDREVILNYLSSTFSQRAPADGGWQNPFLNR